MLAFSGLKTRPLACFQPIISVASGGIFAYEVLGRQREDSGELASLGGFFHDETVPQTQKVLVDRQIRRQALERFRDEVTTRDDRTRLFLNINPRWLIRHGASEDRGRLPTLTILDDLGLAGRRVVIEITEEEIYTDYDAVIPLIDQYRQRGLQIAIDDFYFHNFDRLIELKPDFVKLDLRLLRKSVENADYHKLVNTISAFSQAIGISVIFEGIETDEELEVAIAAGASHVQGFLFSRALEGFQETFRFREQIQNSMEIATLPRFEAAREAVRLERYMNGLVKKFVLEDFRPSGELSRLQCDSLLQRLAGAVPPDCFRMYICDERGVQQSANFVRPGGTEPFRARPEFAGCRWSWRPFFVEGLVRMQENLVGVMSDRYIDVETRQETITFSYPLSGKLFLFLDFS